MISLVSDKLNINSVEAKFLLNEYIENIGINIVINAITNTTGLTELELNKKTRKREIVISRHIGMFIFRNRLKMSHKDSAGVFGMDHASSSYAEKMINTFLDTKNKEVNICFKKVLEQLNEVGVKPIGV